MLRFEHMPSDFHPIFLFLGTDIDLVALASLLRDFAEEPRELSVTDQIKGSRSRTSLTLAPGTVEYGMRQFGQNFKWLLNAWQAERIAERIDVLSVADNKSGSDLFEVGSDGEIPVKVSRGEFTDDFLVGKF
jgi:hypothetical protein